MQDQKQTPNASGMICPCFEFTRDDMVAEIAADPGIGFEEFLAKTNVGSKCTACLLDAEYAFSVLYETARSPDGAADGATRSAKSRRKKAVGDAIPLRQRIYGFFDALSPRVALRLTSIMPVFYGHDVDSFAVMTNNSLLYKGEVCAPDYQFVVTVRDEDGTVVLRESHLVAKEAYCRVRLTEELRKRHPERAFGVGSVGIVQMAKSDGVRGTRRPQLEVVTAHAASALHGQAPYLHSASNTFIAPNRPLEEQPYISVVSNSDTPITMRLTLPLELAGASDGGPVEETHVVAPRGAMLIPLRLPDTLTPAFDAPVMTVGWRASGSQKVHLVTSSLNHDRIALDHL